MAWVQIPQLQLIFLAFSANLFFFFFENPPPQINSLPAQLQILPPPQPASVDSHKSLKPQSHFSYYKPSQCPFQPMKRLNPTPGNEPHQPTPPPITQKQQNRPTTQQESPLTSNQ
jgi:hypothetical protein